MSRGAVPGGDNNRLDSHSDRADLRGQRLITAAHKVGLVTIRNTITTTITASRIPTKRAFAEKRA